MQFFAVFAAIGVVAVSAIASEALQFPSPISEVLQVDKHVPVDDAEQSRVIDDSNPLKTNGYSIFPGQFPHHALLYITIRSVNPEPAFSISSGSLITPNYILTRAFHLHSSITWSNNAYGYAILGVSQGASEQRINFTESGMHVHPMFGNDLNDIATVRLDHPVTFDRFVQPIRLPRLSDFRTYEQMEGTNVARSRYSRNQILTSYECDQLHPERPIKAQHICTNVYVGGNFCPVTHGSGLIVEDENGPVLVGVASIIYYCPLNYPTVYVRVSDFRDWIAANSDYVFDF